MPIIRPRINDIYIIQIRLAYPDETSKLNTIEEVVKFALDKVLEIKHKEKTGEAVILP